MRNQLKFQDPENRLRLIILLITILVSISGITRLFLLIQSAQAVDFTFLNIAGIFFIGFLFDAINGIYFIIPLLIYIWLVPRKIFKTSWNRFILYGLMGVFVFLLSFNAVSELLFWDEFNTRFNFIAVDYLVYTTEVIGNIQQSYPIEVLIVIVVIFSIAVVLFSRKQITATTHDNTVFKSRTKYVLLYLPFPFLVFYTFSSNTHRFSKNTYVNELAGNGLYELFSAYRNNEIDYNQFYKKTSISDAISLVRKNLKTNEGEYVAGENELIKRKIINAGDEKNLNVVLISVESFSANFMGVFGNENNLTPFLDSLSHQSMLFTNLYATGTRTVRGLEALSLCVPPTPGQSIIRRPKNEELFSLGEVFNEKGYVSKYLYGGYGYFDNMNYFFENNGYQVVDRTALRNDQIDYENIWGVADENLFTLALQEIDKTVATGKTVFTQIMTTSNHRPYTYPEGRVDIPSHTSRAGAVKYTDYAIGKFIKEAKKKPWFSNTLFVIVADHCASSAGSTDLPVEKYHIPMLIYSPNNILPSRMDRLMSQIDIGPTILGLLNFSYTSKFFGYDIFKLESGRERAFISTYQLLGFIKDNRLVILSPQQKYTVTSLDGITKSTDQQNNDQLIKEAISWYQTASYEFNTGLMKR